MTESITFTVPGEAQPQGSGRAYTYKRKAEKGGGLGARIDSDNPKLKAWRTLVAWEARRVFRGAALKGPVRLMADCYLPRPKTVKRAVPTVPPDVDKICRGLADAMTGIVYQDDAQITQIKITKSYADRGTSPRVVIVVTPLAEEGRLL